MGNYHRQTRVKNLVTLFLGAVDRPSTRCPAHLTGSWRGPDTPSTGGGPHTQPTPNHHENRLENGCVTFSGKIERFSADHSPW